MSSSPTDTALEEVRMPQMGVSVAEGTITAWRKRPGDWVERDEVIVEISTDKVETEVPAPVAGRVAELLVEEGTTVDVGALLATIDTGSKPGQPHADESEPPPAPAEKAEANGDGKAPPVSPVVRRIADEHSVELSAVSGTGRRGRVTKKDLLAFIEHGPAKPAPAERPLHIESPYKEEQVAPAGEGERLSVMRRQIGEHMVRSLHEAAHCTTIVEADMTAIEAARGRLSYLPLVARATVAALREHPRLNATLEGDRLTVHDEVHLGIAVSLGEEGLIVPVVRNAHELSHEGLGVRIKDLASRARSKQLSPDEVGGATFTITNPGRYGALLATPSSAR